MSSKKTERKIGGVQRDQNVYTPLTVEGDSLFERVPPQNLQAEQSVLGGVMVDPDALGNVLDLLKPEYFYRHAHALIFETIVELYEKHEPVDIITVSEVLSHKEVLEEIGGRSYINDLAMAIATTDNIDYHARLIRDKALLRKLVQIGTEIVTAAYESPQADEAIDTAQQMVFEIAQQGLPQDLVHIGAILPDAFAQIEERSENKGTLMGVSTGFYDLDNYTSGMQKSDLIILAARPSMGKTAFSLNILTHIALRENKPVLIFSLEMAKEQLVLRMLCAEAEIDAQRIRTGEVTENDFARLSQAMGKLGDAPIYIDDTPGMGVMEMRAKARKVLAEVQARYDKEGREEEAELGLIMIDYLQLMEGPKSAKSGGEGNRTQEISQISRGLKGIARELKAPVMALSQLSRAVEQRQDKKPMLSDLRESGSIEQDADIVMFIYRDEYYNKESERPGTADIIIAKQRNGPVGEVELLFRHNITRFLNPADRKIRIF